MRKMLAITALTVAGLATVSNAGQVKPVVSRKSWLSIASRLK